MDRHSTNAAAIAIDYLLPRHARGLNALFREALAESPTAFTSDFARIKNRPLAAVIDHLRELEHSAAFRLGAFDDNGDLVGTVRLNPRAGTKLGHGADVLFLYVKSAYRQHGLGRALMSQLIAAAHGIDGLQQLELAVSRDSVAAVKLYESLGFEATGVLRRQIYVGDQFHDLIPMWLRL